MGPIIILDKSTLQSLSFNELIILHKYYHLNLVPVLVIEILADLKKQMKGDRLSEDEVIKIANKLLLYDSMVNIHYKYGIVDDLLGNTVKMRRVPIIAGGKPVKTEDNRIGLIFEETVEEKALKRWRKGQFIEADNILADRWREINSNYDLKAYKDHLKSVYTAVPKFNDFEEITRYLDEILIEPALQVKWLMLLIGEFDLTNIGQGTFYRWESQRYDLIKNFAPYAYYCLYVKLFFQYGLMCDLIKTSIRSHSIIDLEYLYYLPFCMAFVSNDDFHKRVSKSLLNSNQTFVDGDTLKKDLGRIYAELNKITEMQDNKNDYSTYPPRNNDSITSMIWAKNMNYPEESPIKQKTTSQKHNDKVLIDAMLKELDSREYKGHVDTDNADFVIRRRHISINDLCPCGSGIQFKNCHGKNINTKLTGK